MKTKPAVLGREAVSEQLFSPPPPDVRRPDIRIESTRTETRLIVACARTVLDADSTRTVAELLRGDIDWAYLFQRANQHGVATLLYFNLVSHFAHDLSDEVLSQLRRELQAHARHNLLLARELVRIANLLDEKGIPVLPFKGPVLAIVAYRNLALRQFADLDILVHKRDAVRTKRILEQEGYRIDVPLTYLQKLAPVLSSRKDLVLVNPANNIRIELHWRLTGRHFSFPIGARQLWRRTQRVSFAGSVVRSLAPTHLLLYLCMHGSRHGWERLQWICDVAEFVRLHQDLDWQRVWAEARAIRNERNLALGLRLAHEILNAPLPKAVNDRVIPDQTVARLVETIRTLLCAPQPARPDISFWRQYHLRVKERMRDRVRLRLYYGARYLRLATNPTVRDRAFVLLPGSLSFLYYLVRPLRLLKIRIGAQLAQLGLRRRFQQSAKR